MISWDVLPIFLFYDKPHVRTGDTELLCKDVVRNVPSFSQPTKFTNIFGGKFMHPVPFPFCISLFTISVVRVFGRCSQKKMTRITTGWIVTFVTNTKMIWEIAVTKQVNKTVSTKLNFS